MKYNKGKEVTKMLVEIGGIRYGQVEVTLE